jgi:hypothetical protein
MCLFFKYWTVHSGFPKVSGGEINAFRTTNLQRKAEIIAKKMNDSFCGAFNFGNFDLKPNSPNIKDQGVTGKD